VGGEQVEGRQAVRELLLAGRRAVKEIWVADNLEVAAILDEINEAAATGRVRVRTVPRARLDETARTDSPQGVIGFAAPLVGAELDALSGPATASDGVPFLLVLDGITDPQNLGALLRTAVCAGVTGVVLPRHRATHVTPAVTKAAAGAIEHVPVAVVPGIPSALARLRDTGVWSVGLDVNGPVSLWDLEVATEPVALVLGAEGRGLSRLTRERCDLLVHIPQRAALSSLNVSAAGAIASFEVSRRRSPSAH
jgi:23S rRNA (guanosine2251-2'-O)-methyltransferase